MGEHHHLTGVHPRQVLLGAQAATGVLPVCDHYSGVEPRIRKSLQLQAELMAEFGACVFDATLDCEDGSPVGGELDHAQMVVGLLQEIHEQDRQNPSTHVDAGWRRTGVRFHPVEHPAFESDVDIIAGTAGALLSHVMVPKVESVADVDRAVLAIDAAMVRGHQVRKDVLPLHVLLESSAAVHRAFDIAQHPRVQSISFGLMDFVSSHGGAIPESAMRVESQNSSQDLGQFSHPLVVRAKLEIAAACHAHGKVPSHCVVTEFADVQAMRLAAQRACREFGYTRMWSIHPSQIRPILEAMAPTEADVEQAAAIIEAAATAHWAPVNYKNQLHDRASYRYFWHILERAHSTGRVLPNSMWAYFNTQPNPTH